MDYREHKVASLGDLRGGRDEISTLNLFKEIFIEHDKIVKFSPHI